MPLSPAGLYYESTGTGFPLVMLHGVTLDGRMWQRQVAHFAARYRCITVDSRGHGRSAPYRDGRDADQDLLDVLDHAGVGRCHLLGLSMGGGDAVGFAARRPEHVAAVVLADAWLPIPEMGAWKPPARLAREQGVEAARAAWLANPVFATAALDPKTAALVREMVAGNDLAIWTRRWAPPDPAPPPAAAVAHTVQAPTLVLVGALDVEGFQDTARWLHATIPGARGRDLVSIPGAGHLAPLEQPAAFNAAVGQFLEQVEAAWVS